MPVGRVVHNKTQVVKLVTQDKKQINSSDDLSNETQHESGNTDEPLRPSEEIGGPGGPEPTRYGDWERKGRCIDF